MYQYENVPYVYHSVVIYRRAKNKIPTNDFLSHVGVKCFIGNGYSLW